jgi:hypothetical protein
MSYPTAGALDYTDTGNRVYNYVQQLLTVVNDAAVQLGLTLPACQYVTGGQAVFDTEQVAATGIQVTTGLPGAENMPLSIPLVANCMPPMNIQVRVSIVRCLSPNAGGQITTTVLDAAFLQTSRDFAVLLLATEMLVTTQLFGHMLFRVYMEPPEGGLSATTLLLTAALP